MSYIKKTIRTTSTETEFIKTFIRELTADEHIVCESDEDTINKATIHNDTAIYIKINDLCKIKIVRFWPINARCRSYNFSAIINNKEYSKVEIMYNSGESGSSDIAIRTFNFSVVSNDNMVFVSIGNHDCTTINSGSFFILSANYDNFTAAGSSNLFYSLNTMYCTDEAHANIDISLFNRLPYYDTSGTISIIDSKILVNAGANTKFTEVFTGMIDCSCISSPNVITTEYGRYFVLNEYTLIPIVDG